MKNVKRVLAIAVVICVLLMSSVAVSAADPVNLALTATATASSQFNDTNWNVTGVNDGKMDTCWAPSWEDTPKLTLTLKEEAEISTIVLYGRFDIEGVEGKTEADLNDRTTDFIDELDISIDGKVVKSITNYPRQSFTTPVTVKFDTPIKGKEILIDVISGKANPGFTEVQVFAGAAPVNNQTPAPTDKPSDNTPKTGDVGTMFSLVLAGAAALGGLKLRKK